MYLNLMRELIESYINISEKEWEEYSPSFKTFTCKRDDLLLCSGQVCSNIFIVVKGLLRVYFVNDKGKERTFHFVPEKDLVTDYESFIKGNPSSYAIQAMEDSEIVIWSYEHHQSVYKRLQEGEKLGRMIAEEYLFHLSRRMQAFYLQSPLERYEALKKEQPSIFQRVPQHYIASFLNITSVHLSRLKRNSTI